MTNTKPKDQRWSRRGLAALVAVIALPLMALAFVYSILPNYERDASRIVGMFSRPR